MKTKIVISAVNLVEGGPLTILRSCLKALNDYSAYNDVEVLALVHKKELCSFSNITYIEVPWAKNNWIYRIFFEFFYLKKNSRKIKPYLWFSLHDTSPNVKAAKRSEGQACRRAQSLAQLALSPVRYRTRVRACPF